MMDKFEWRTEDRFMSNNGSGPLMARILCIAGGVVRLERWNRKEPSKQRSTGEVSLKYFTSPRCGWKKVKNPTPRDLERR
jgi:hypothetical protein